MKLTLLLVMAVGLLCATEFVAAVTRVPKGGGGIQGTITTVGTQGFAMTTKDGKTIDVLCNANTQFMMGGEKADPADIKTGVMVGVEGGKNSETQYTANVVNILPAKGKKKT